jgi:hypothetical protein
LKRDIWSRKTSENFYENITVSGKSSGHLTGFPAPDRTHDTLQGISSYDASAGSDKSPIDQSQMQKAVGRPVVNEVFCSRGYLRHNSGIILFPAMMIAGFPFPPMNRVIFGTTENQP